MEATKAYVITWVCLFITYLILKWPKKLLRPALGPCIRLLPRFIQKWPRYFKIHRRTLYCWNSQRVTLTHYFICFVYLVGNVLLFVRPTFRKGVAIVKTDSDERQRRAAVAGLTNLVPVIFGGRTCFLADAFNIPLQQYYFAHHWLARLAVIEITVHVIAQTHGGLVWTGHAAVGLTAFILLLFMGVSSVAWVRLRYQNLFAWAHLGLAILVLGAILSHVWLLSPRHGHLESKIPISLAALIWSCTCIYRFVRSQQVRGDIRRIYGPLPEISSNRQCASEQYTGAAFLNVKLPNSILLHPGAYFYVYFRTLPARRRYLGYPMTAWNWKPLTDSDGWENNCRYITELHFLIEDSLMLSAPLSAVGVPVTIEGPYGRDLGLQKFDTVCLIADGIGIASILPLALSLADRCHFDRIEKAKWLKEPAPDHSQHRRKPQIHGDRIRRLNLFWVLDEGQQINWIKQELPRLAALDPKRALLQIDIFCPDMLTARQGAQLLIPEAFQRHWKVHYTPREAGEVNLERPINYCLDTHPGDIAVAVSGKVELRMSASNILTRHAHPACFFELEHQPKGSYVAPAEAVNSPREHRAHHAQPMDAVPLTDMPPPQMRYRAQQVHVVRSEKRGVSLEAYFNKV